MGYYSGWNTRSELVKELTQGEPNLKTLAHKVVREGSDNILWAVHRVSETYKDPTKRGETFIACYLLCHRKLDGYGYKPMDESMGPIFVSCPRDYLQMAPIQNPKWRESVEAYHQKDVALEMKVRTLRIGETLKLTAGCNPPEVEVAQLNPLRGYYKGKLYRVSKRYIALEAA